jgi:tetratricopeptide (TPR) repeat protein
MRTLQFRKALPVAGAAVLMLALAPAAGYADFGAPKPKVDCTKKENKDKSACKPWWHGDELSNDEIYNAAYWLARQGQYRQALDVLQRARDSNDPRILNATGFATRKLGDVDGALVYYRRALALDPNHVVTREYMGEAFLAKGDAASAKAQLSEIETRCGAKCEAYVHLATSIRAFEGSQARGG